jgi:DNA-binding transcriptional regulator YhcF (GntR family)
MQFREPRSIYQQIADQIRERILQGEWKAGERIPSIRDFAIEIGVNPNTVTKSYQALMDRRVIENQRGLGYFVASHATDRIIEEMRHEFEKNEVPRLARAIRLLGINKRELGELLDRNNSEDKT